MTPYSETGCKYHQRFDKELQVWYYVLDSDGNKVRSNICLCKATKTSECTCGAWNEYWDNMLELDEIY